MKTSREARIYRVNAWREMKGRPALTFAEPVAEAPKVNQNTEPYPPEWWTTENTAAWHKAVWGGSADLSAAQQGWGSKYQHGEKIRRGGAGTYTPIKPKVMAKWRESDPRPTPTTFYDGRTDHKRAALPTAMEA